MKFFYLIIGKIGNKISEGGGPVPVFNQLNFSLDELLGFGSGFKSGSLLEGSGSLSLDVYF